MTQLPGYCYGGDDPDGFISRDEVVQYLEAYAAFFDAPLRLGVQVESLQRKPDSSRYVVRASGAVIETMNVVVATGPFQQSRIPPFSPSLPSELLQLHSRDYNNPAQLPPGAVLVV